MQTGLAIIIGIIAFIYVVITFGRQLLQTEKNPKCENCPVPEIIKQNIKSAKESN